MRRAALLLFAVATACGGTTDPDAPRTMQFGPFTVQPQQEVLTDCVQLTLNNTDPIFVSSVELTTGAGFHHSNWFFVPETLFAGPHWNGSNSSVDDGTFTCGDRNFDQAVVSISGGPLFAQSTQASHGIQQFPEGVAIKIPPHYKLVAQIHLLNPGDTALTIHPEITITPIPQAEVTTLLSGISFEDHALGLPPQKQSSFSVDCDLSTEWSTLHAMGDLDSAVPNFHIYYGLAHYHALGTGMLVEAVTSDGTAATVYDTTATIGDSLGQTLAPPFDMTGYTRLRVTCDYFNATSGTVTWGNGDGEMCVLLAFSDSPYHWGGGEVTDEAPGDPTIVGETMTYSAPCQVYADDASH